jgi:hypothetical protein
MNTGITTEGKYIVSEDIHLLLKGWTKGRGFTLPPRSFFITLREEFSNYMKQIFKGFEMVSEEELSLGLQKLVQGNHSLTLLAIDRVYCQPDLRFEITRLIDSQGHERGIGRRPGASSIIDWLIILQKEKIKKVALVDDVIFSGHSLAVLITLLQLAEIQVPLVYAGISVRKGIERLESLGVKVSCVRTYQKLIDQVCQRDFYPGVPFCGRTLIGGNNIGIPYLLPFGNPLKWASIPIKWQGPLSRFCYKQTIKLFETIEHYSKRTVLCQDLDRKIISFPTDSTPYLSCLREIINNHLTLNPRLLIQERGFVL